MTPFYRARKAAHQLRETLFNDTAMSAIRSDMLIQAVADEGAEDLMIEEVNPTDAMLGGADAILIRNLRQIIVRNDVSSDEKAFLIAHEFGHWKLHPEDHDSCYKVIDSNMNPKAGDTLGSQKVESYGARERSELQANIFAREFLLPREVSRNLFLTGKSAKQICADLDLPLELVRQQLLDTLLLPAPILEDDVPQEPLTPTPDQTRAATSKDKISLVVAGPGTGKTATLLLRVQHLLSNGVKPSELLLLTFSNRAARELLDKLQTLGIQDAHDIWVGTFHTFGLEFLRKHHDQFNLSPQFGVADRMAQLALLEPHIYGLGLSAFNPYGDPLDWLNEAVKTIQRSKDELADAKTFSAAVEISASETNISDVRKQRDISKLYTCYEKILHEHDKLVDLGDLVMLPAIALSQNYNNFIGSVGRFKHILVDEYQDVNRASAQLVKALSIHAESLWVVGDARQAIYRFRGASMRNIINFGDDFPEHQTFHLNENRRSYEEVIRVFEHAGRDSNPLQMLLPLNDVEPVRGTSGVRPRHIQCEKDNIVHGELVSHISQLHDLGVAFRDQVVLASTHDTCGASAKALNEAGVPALHLGNIFQRSEIKDLLAILQLFIDRSGSGIIRLTRLQGFEIPAEDIEYLLAWLNENRPEALSWLDTPPPGLSPSCVAILNDLANVFHGLSSLNSPWEVVCELLLERTNILRPHLSGDTILDITRRIALWQFIYYLRVPDGNLAYQTVGSFITRLRRRLRIGDDKELRIPPPEADNIDAVAVMTIHGSKGLEFEAVHLVDIDAKHFCPSTDSELIPRTLLQAVKHKSNFEEETEASNKLYVALSRAKKHLILYESCERYDAKCVNTIQNATHLLETVRVNSSTHTTTNPATTNSTVSNLTSYDLAGFLSYRVCPRRYYYEYIKKLNPSAGLHPAALVEGAVMRELFSANNDMDKYTDEVERTLASLSPDFKHALPYLKDYAYQLLTNGRTWIGAEHAMMANSFSLDCSGLTLNVQPHRVSTNGNTHKIEFVRTRTSGKQARQHKILKWVLKYLTEKYPNHSFDGSIFVLSTGDTESVTPYGCLPDDFFLKNIANNLMSGHFDAQPSSWNCPRCRHFMYCPT